MKMSENRKFCWLSPFRIKGIQMGNKTEDRKPVAPTRELWPTDYSEKVQLKDTQWTRFEDELPPEGKELLVKDDSISSYLVMREGDKYIIQDEYTIDSEYLTHWHLITPPEGK